MPRNEPLSDSSFHAATKKIIQPGVTIPFSGRPSANVNSVDARPRAIETADAYLPVSREG